MVRVYDKFSSSNEACTCWIWELRPSLSAYNSSPRLRSLERKSDSCSSLLLESCCKNSFSFSTAFFSSRNSLSLAACWLLISSFLVYSWLTSSSNCEMRVSRYWMAPSWDAVSKLRSLTSWHYFWYFYSNIEHNSVDRLYFRRICSEIEIDGPEVISWCPVICSSKSRCER